jgi:hypothetical protein
VMMMKMKKKTRKRMKVRKSSLNDVKSLGQNLDYLKANRLHCSNVHMTFLHKQQ